METLPSHRAIPLSGVLLQPEGSPRLQKRYAYLPRVIKQVLFRTLFILPLLCFCLAVPTQDARAQQPANGIRYVYDEAGRLRAVISPNGEQAIYEYDAVGNLTAIRRLAAGALELISFAPHAGAAGDLVTFSGVGFGAGVSSVQFNNVSATIVSVNSSTIVAEVPANATTGTVRITTGSGILTTSEPFTITPRVTVTPSYTRLFPNDRLQFYASIVSGTGNETLSWSVNGIEGGNSTVGTISASGLYLAPAQKPSSSITIKATRVGSPALFGRAEVAIINNSDVRQFYSPMVAVMKGGESGLAAVFSGGVSILRSQAQGQAYAFSQGVSVLRQTASGNASVVSMPVSVMLGEPPTTERINVAAATNGGVASASSTDHATNYPINAINNSDRKGMSGTGYGYYGCWADGTPGVNPDWVQIDFAGQKTISEVDVFTLQDNYQNPVEPTETQTFSTHGVIDFEVQYWTGSAWVAIPNGSVTGNNKIWRKFEFPDITTSKIRVMLNQSVTGNHYITEVEAY